MKTPRSQEPFSNHKCYAWSLNNCSDALSREHYISKSILKDWGGKFKASGARWLQDGESRIVTEKTMTARILCDCHNEELTGLDSEAHRFIGILSGSWKGVNIRDGQPLAKEYTFDGNKIERWLLKALCGLLSSGGASSDRKRIDWAPNPYWIRILFGLDPMPSDWGLYFGVPADSFVPTDHFSLEAAMVDGKEGRIVCGGRIVFFGLSWIISMTGRIQQYLSSVRFAEFRYRPVKMIVQRPSGSVVMNFTWDHAPDQETVTVITSSN